VKVPIDFPLTFKVIVIVGILKSSPNDESYYHSLSQVFFRYICS